MDVEKQDVKKHGTEDFPLAIYKDYVPSHVFSFTRWHWHNALQFCLMKKGSVYFQVNHDKIYLKEGEGLFINSGQMHCTYNENAQDCCYLCFSLEPVFLCGYAGSVINSKFVNPVVQDPGIAYCHLDNSRKWHKTVLSHLAEIYGLYESGGSELDIHIAFWSIWSLLYKHDFQTADKPVSRIDDRIKPVIHYIENHYQEKIELAQLAKEAGFARTYCCREFKRNMNCSVFEYITNFRLLKSIELLCTDLSVTEIAYQCGFGSTSFYIKKFKEKTGISPNRYRKNIRNRAPAEQPSWQLENGQQMRLSSGGGAGSSGRVLQQPGK